MTRFFNTTGPCHPSFHYTLPAEARLPKLDQMVDRQQYFVLHAPRQTGKTTAMRAFAERRRTMGEAAVYATLETSQGIEQVAQAEIRWLNAIGESARRVLPSDLWPPSEDEIPRGDVGGRLSAWLTQWCAALGRPVVLLLDEVDVLTGPPLVSLLRQLRGGFPERLTGGFPISIGLVGMRDLQDWLTLSKDGSPMSPGSPFNINAGSMTLRNFNRDEVAALLAQHTAETGQPFTQAASDVIFTQTAGQPFLVNWLADRCVTELQPDRSRPIDRAEAETAAQDVILSRTTHLRSLSARLQEPRVANIIRDILLGDRPIDVRTDDLDYAIDLGLVVQCPEGPVIANPIYREVIARQLSLSQQQVSEIPARGWRLPDGRLDMATLITSFLAWWRENAEMTIESEWASYREAVPHLALMGWLQRVVNGGGTILREYAAGRGRLDLLVTLGTDRHLVELKRVPARGGSPETILRKGIEQTAEYLDRTGLSEGWLLIFDQRPGLSWDERLWQREVEVNGRTVHIRGG